MNKAEELFRKKLAAAKHADKMREGLRLLRKHKKESAAIKYYIQHSGAENAKT
jgi:hypothetical protein